MVWDDAAGAAGRRHFQVFAPHDRAESPENERDAEFEAARLIDLLEPAGWTLENVARARERENEWAYGAQAVTVVGTIYTFLATRV